MTPKAPLRKLRGFCFWDALFARNLVATLPAPVISRDNPPLLKILSLERL
ncbi:hypothetical protein ACIGKM_11165 [Ectopseudomonas toyotomiensis]